MYGFRQRWSDTILQDLGDSYKWLQDSLRRKATKHANDSKTQTPQNITSDIYQNFSRIITTVFKG